MGSLTRAVSWPNATARQEERKWQRLCQVYLPRRVRGSIWRASWTQDRDKIRQGWKIHVSATILTACRIFRAVAPYLKKRDIPFKAPRSLAELQNLNAGVFYGFSQVGKFLTIYPASPELARSVALYLDRLTRKLNGPIIPYDRRLRSSSCVYYRYGSFSNETLTVRRKKVSVIARPDGRLVPDRRQPGAAVPSWLRDPFNPGPERTARSLTPLETGYRDYEALVQRGRGGVYRARDKSSIRGRTCILKEGRRHGETDWRGGDGFERIKQEARFLETNQGLIAGLPRVLRTFRADNTFYLVMENVPGRSLHEIIVSKERISFRRLLVYCANMARILADLHARGWAWRDCKPANFLAQKNGRLRPLDFEGACRLDEPDPLPWGTSAYMAPEWGRSIRDLEAADLYALGISFAQSATRNAALAGVVPRFRRMARRQKLPAPFAQLVLRLVSPQPAARPRARAVHLQLREQLLATLLAGFSAHATL